MNTQITIWHHWPTLADYHQHRQQYPADQHLYDIVVSHQLPEYFSQPIDSIPVLYQPLHRQLTNALRYWQNQPRYLINQPQPNSTLLFVQPQEWQTHLSPPSKPWLAMPQPIPISHVCVIGAGIAGAATAYILAQHGIKVSLLDKYSQPAQAASGNRQGLLYAKISTANTPQTELLLTSYGYSRQLLEHSLPLQYDWQSCGVLHLDHNASEQRRNQQLAHIQNPLYQYVDADTASSYAGIQLQQGGLWWRYGAWLHPSAWVHALIKHPKIQFLPNHTVSDIHRHDELPLWEITTNHHSSILASHIVFCMGADHHTIPLLNQWPFQFIRGQTTVANASPLAQQLKCAISGKSYLSPAWDNQLCFGATFIPNDTDYTWRLNEQQQNWAELAQLHPHLAESLISYNPDWQQPSGHAAIRCDSFDHLPVVGPIADATAMFHTYEKLAFDKNYRITTDCPWLPGLYFNTAHGSRGLTTAPLCAQSIVCQILGLPNVLSHRLQQALHPSRLIIRRITHRR